MGKNIRTFIQNQALKIFIWTVWLGVNIYLFTDTYLLYRNSDKYHYLYMLLKDSICLSRACAMALNFNCALILIPMCRTVNSFVRTKVLKYIHSNPRRLINHMKGLHIMCAFTICVLGVIHSLSHLVNVMRFRMNYTKVVEELNPNKDSKEDTTLWFFLTEVAGWSGIVMLLVLSTVVLTSFQAVRRKHYEIFWFTHHLSLCFLILVGIHGLGGITKWQSNLKEHPRRCQSLDFKTWMNNTMNCEPPKFEPNGAQTWKWLIGPFCLYIIDRIIRWYRATRNVTIAKVTLHEGRVIELHMLKKGFKAKPGHYILVQCPDIAEFEWHAFTLSKIPTAKEGDAATFSVHIKVTGNWTELLKELLLESCEENGVELKRVGDSCVMKVDAEWTESACRGALPIIRVDGPYGSPNEDSFRYPVNVSVAAGIGITPFACVLNYLKYLDPTNLNKKFKMKRIYLVWVCRDIKEFTWFLELMSDTVKHLESINMPDMLVCHLYVTRDSKLTTDDPSMIDQRMQWFQKRLNYGRPKFDEILKTIAQSYNKTRIGVFFCGPNPLAHALYEACTVTKDRENSFIFHKESFA